jgi:hypothetical protein
MSKKLFLIFFICIYLKQDVISQQKNISFSDQQWFQYFLDIRVAKKWTIFSNFGVRSKEGFTHPHQHVIFTGITYKLNDEIRFYQGFTHLGIYKNDVLSKVEFRPFQEFRSKHKYGITSIVNRMRVEERFFKTIVNNVLQDGYSFNFRFRYLFLLNIKLFNFAPKKNNSALLLSLGDEIFLNAGTNIVYNVFDQNRLLLGVIFKLHENLSILLTYDHQLITSNVPNSYRENSIIWLRIRQKIDVRKKS